MQYRLCNSSDTPSGTVSRSAYLRRDHSRRRCRRQCHRQGIGKNGGRCPAQQKVAQDAAAHSRGQAQHRHAQQGFRLQLAVGQQIVDDPLHVGRGNCKTQAFHIVVLGGHLDDIDADHLTVHIEKSTAGIAGIDILFSDVEERINKINAYETGFWGDKDYWAPECHYYKGKYYIWQRCDYGHIEGIDGSLDVDIMYLN